MLLSGDEVGKSQKGNNNVYCQDNELAWFDWSLVDTNSDLLRFTQKMIHFRRNNNSLRRCEFFAGEVNSRGLADISWHGCQVFSPGWNDENSKVLGFTIGSFEDNEPDIHVMMNMNYEPLEFEIPQINGRKWYRFVDTSSESPDDILTDGKELILTAENYTVNSYSIVILISK
jgi:glycogen operon protein